MFFLFLAAEFIFRAVQKPLDIRLMHIDYHSAYQCSDYRIRDNALRILDYKRLNDKSNDRIGYCSGDRADRNILRDNYQQDKYTD